MALTQAQLKQSEWMILGRIDLAKILPHSEDFQLLDSVEYDFTNPFCIIAYAFLSKNNPIFAKHFPGNPIYRAIELIEMLNLSAAVLINIMENPPEGTKGLPMSKEVRNFEIIRGTYPETHVRIETRFEDRFIEKRIPKFLFSGRVLNDSNGKILATGQIIGIAA